jgi:hypothetical protein
VPSGVSLGIADCNEATRPVAVSMSRDRSTALREIMAGFGGMQERGELRSTLRSWIVDETPIVNS